MKSSALGRWLAGTTRTPSPATNDTEHPFSSRSSAENNNNYSPATATTGTSGTSGTCSTTAASDLAAVAAPRPGLGQGQGPNQPGQPSQGAPTPTSSHSLTSPSPSPQPATPDDQFNNIPGRNNYFSSASASTPSTNTTSINNNNNTNICTGASTTSFLPASHFAFHSASRPSSKPIDIAVTSAPRIRSDNSISPPPDLTNNPTIPLESDFLQLNVDGDLDFDLDLDDLEMTTGPALDSAVGRSRQDSFVSAGPKPISMINPNREQANRGRRESLAGSLMNGMSWGGASVGSFIRDE
ncbi:hypothetical protein F4804DRAFT_60706 [Jackrogersella minutella]|nr:hypothetical protein F4804DRAFT_60706 [Jackrogersella minutella]